MTVTVCDFHPKEIRQVYRVQLFLERKMDAAGSMDNEYEVFDLCGECQSLMLSQLSSVQQQALAVSWSAYRKTPR